MRFFKVAQQAVPQLQMTLNGPQYHDMPVDGLALLFMEMVSLQAARQSSCTLQQKLGRESLVKVKEFI